MNLKFRTNSHVLNTCTKTEFLNMMINLSTERKKKEIHKWSKREK